MERARRRAKVVKPLLSGGPWKEKEVEVFERERGGSGRPPVVEPKSDTDGPVREFLRREEKVIKKLPLRPEDRRILKLYLDAIRRRG